MNDNSATVIPNNATYLHFPFCKPSTFYWMNSRQAAAGHTCIQGQNLYEQERNKLKIKMKWKYCVVRIYLHQCDWIYILKCDRINNWLISGYFIINKLKPIIRILRRRERKRERAKKRTNQTIPKWIEVTTIWNINRHNKYLTIDTEDVLTTMHRNFFWAHSEIRSLSLQKKSKQKKRFICKKKVHRFFFS